MQLCLTLTKDELSRVVQELLPFDIEISERPRRRISLEHLQTLELVSGSGVRISGDASLTWEVAALPVTLTLRKWQVLLVPRVVFPDNGDKLLVFDPNLETLDFKHVPGFVDDRVADVVNEAISSQKSKLVWNFGKSLSLHKPLSDKLSPTPVFDLSPTGADVDVTDSVLSLSIRFAAKMIRQERAPAPVATTPSTPP